MKTLVILLSIAGLAIAGAVEQVSRFLDPAIPADPHAFFDLRMRQSKLPGLAVAILRDGEVVWAEGFGRLDAGIDQPVTPETLFHVASVSKTITGTAVMQLVEQDLIGLDDAVDNYVSFPMRNPAFPESPITIRQLLTHTSSLHDDEETYMAQYTLDAGGGDPEISLRDFVEGYLRPGGLWYDAEANFLDTPPGSTFEYSNIGFALLGLLVEQVTGMDFSDYCRANIFEPLGITGTGWRIAGVDETQLAHPHSLKRGVYEVLPHYSYATYPDGALRTSVAEYASFLQAMMNGGIGANGARILQAKTVSEMIRTQFPELNSHQGLAWDTCQTGKLTPERCANGGVPGHTGGDPGVFTLVFFVPDEKAGAILFTNGLPELTPGSTLNLLSLVERLVFELDRRGAE